MLDTLNNVKTRLGITTTADDAFLTAQIEYISSVIEAYCGRIFLADDYIQTFYREDMKRSPLLEMFHYPVNAVTEIKVDTVVKDPTTYRLNKPSGYVTNITSTFPEGKEMIVKFNAGYATCPLPVRGVLDALVNQRYNKKKTGVDLDFGSDIQRLSIPGAIAIDFDYSLTTNARESAYGTVIGNHANVLDHWRSDRAVQPNSTLIYCEEAP